MQSSKTTEMAIQKCDSLSQQNIFPVQSDYQGGAPDSVFPSDDVNHSMIIFPQSLNQVTLNSADQNLAKMEALRCTV